MQETESPLNQVPFNPLDKINLGESVVAALEKRPSTPLESIESFYGAGVYALYYQGSFPLYRPLLEPYVGVKPIYVGKAVSPGARKGKILLDEKESIALYNRLREHADSIQEVDNLNLADFLCRFLTVDDIWIPLAETLLIAKYSPIWNIVVEGFGNHDPGKGRSNQQKSRWDTLHNGRRWAEKLQPNVRSIDQIVQDVEIFFNAKEREQL